MSIDVRLGENIALPLAVGRPMRTLLSRAEDRKSEQALVDDRTTELECQLTAQNRTWMS